MWLKFGKLDSWLFESWAEWYKVKSNSWNSGVPGMLLWWSGGSLSCSCPLPKSGFSRLPLDFMRFLNILFNFLSFFLAYNQIALTDISKSWLCLAASPTTALIHSSLALAWNTKVAFLPIKTDILILLIYICQTFISQFKAFSTQNLRVASQFTLS